ncbi:MAG: selenium-dependent xanthine dehydrogenase, partial [Treponema sp.]|nr:selenium-dependent xanthine dehydrogenase [Treponema sp.]
MPQGELAAFSVNGKPAEGPSDKKLLDFLREDLRLTAAKNGCGAGVCGACTVLVDGKPIRSCVTTLLKVREKSVVTVEGLSEREKEVYSFAFAEAGAVQCGFCIPGMVLSAKALIEGNNNPTELEIRSAIRSNICRCTGYKKIVEAIQLAASFFKSGDAVPHKRFSGALGENMHRPDAETKVTGAGKYVDDLRFEGMLHVSAIRSKYPRARIIKIDASGALAHPDCAAVLTAKDVPGNVKIGHLSHVSDYDVMIAEGSETRFIGDALALVVAGNRDNLEKIKSLVKIEYEALTPLTSPEAAMAEGAPLIHDKKFNILSHERLTRGNADEVLAKSKYVVKRHYSFPFTEHAFMEPECAIAMPDSLSAKDRDGRLILYSAGQGIYDEQRECSRMLGIPPENIRVISQFVGGGFGGKEDMSVQHHACLAAWKLKKPVKALLSRQESVNLHPKRHAMEAEFTTGCDENGILTAMKAQIVSDTGAYASLGGPVLQRACTHAAGPYNYQVIDIDGKAVYTNNIPSGAFRGFGVPQSCFATESNINLLAEMAGLSQWEIRFRNAIRPGQTLPNGQIASDDTELEACLLALKAPYEKAVSEGKSLSIAAAFKNSGIGVGLPDIGRCILSVEKGIIHIRTSAACIGQGLAAALIQIACETLDLPPKFFIVEPPDTRRAPNAGTTTASRQTLFTGEAVRQAALKLKTALENTEGDFDGLESREFYGEYSAITDPINSTKPHPVSHAAYSFAAVLAVLDGEG